MVSKCAPAYLVPVQCIPLVGILDAWVQPSRYRTGCCVCVWEPVNQQASGWSFVHRGVQVLKIADDSGCKVCEEGGRPNTGRGGFLRGLPGWVMYVWPEGQLERSAGFVLL